MLGAMRRQHARWPRRLRRLRAACAGALLGLALVPRDAAAYIDPGVGSMIVQGLIAALVGSGLALRLRWRKIRERLSRKRRADAPDEEVGAPR